MGNCPLIHANEAHLIEQAKIHKAAKAMVESLNLAAGSTAGFDVYKLVETYFTDLDCRHKMNKILGIEEDPEFYGEQEQIRENQ